MSSILRTSGCKVGRQSWGPDVGDVSGAHHKCLYCHKTKRVGTKKYPPGSHSSDGYMYPSGS
jgi:hypothetical protein